MRLRFPPALYHRRFRYLWLGQMISIAGSQMQVWALFWNIRTLTSEPIALGGIGLARILPIVLLSLIGGTLADRVNRRNLLFVTQTCMALGALALALLSYAGKINLWYIYGLTAVQAAALAFDGPARQALVPNLVPPADLPSAFSLNSIAFQTGAVVGPAFSGIIIAYWGQAYTYLINAISFLAVIIALILIGPVSQQIVQKTTPVINLADIKEGIRFIARSPIILSTMFLDFLATFFSSANTLMPIFARDILNVGPVAYGWLSSAQSIGAVIAAVALSQVSQLRRQGPILLVSVVVFGIATIVFGLSRSFLLTMAALIVIGAADSVSTIIRNTVRQLQTPDYIRGRMTSINQIFFMGGPQLGEIEAGLVAQIFSAPFAVISGGIGCMVAVAWTIRRWPILRKYNGDEPIQAGVPAD